MKIFQTIKYKSFQINKNFVYLFFYTGMGWAFRDLKKKMKYSGAYISIDSNAFNICALLTQLPANNTLVLLLVHNISLQTITQLYIMHPYSSTHCQVESNGYIEVGGETDFLGFSLILVIWINLHIYPGLWLQFVLNKLSAQCQWATDTVKYQYTLFLITYGGLALSLRYSVFFLVDLQGIFSFDAILQLINKTHIVCDVNDV